MKMKKLKEAVKFVLDFGFEKINYGAPDNQEITTNYVYRKRLRYHFEFRNEEFPHPRLAQKKKKN